MKFWPGLLTVVLLALAPAARADFESGLRAHARNDHDLALWEWLLAGHQGDAAAQFNAGTAYYNGETGPPDYAAAAAWYRRAAAQGHVGAQFVLGLMTHAGRGVPQDFGAAAAWFRRAAEQGHPRAQHNLAVLHRTGRGVPRDDREAARWFLRAAEQGHPAAQLRAALLYEAGEGQPMDLVEAYKWYALAADRLTGTDRTEVERQLRRLGERLTDAERTAGRERVRAWRPRAEGLGRGATVWPRALADWEGLPPPAGAAPAGRATARPIP